MFECAIAVMKSFLVGRAACLNVLAVCHEELSGRQVLCV